MVICRRVRICGHHEQYLLIIIIGFFLSQSSFLRVTIVTIVLLRQSAFRCIMALFPTVETSNMTLIFLLLVRVFVIRILLAILFAGRGTIFTISLLPLLILPLAFSLLLLIIGLSL